MLFMFYIYYARFIHLCLLLNSLYYMKYSSLPFSADKAATHSNMIPDSPHSFHY